LHDEPELISWLPGEKSLVALSQRIDEVDASPLQLTEAQKREQRMHKVQLTAAEIEPAARQLYAHRLWRTAEVLERKGRVEPARIARAEARLLFHEANAPSRFLERMF